MRGWAPDEDFESQNDDAKNFGDIGKADAVKEKDDSDGKKSSHAGVVGAVVVLLFSLVVFGAAVWWSYGQGNQCPGIWRGYEQVADHDNTYLMNDFSTSTTIP